MAECSTVEVCVPGCDVCFVVNGPVVPKLHLVDAAGEPADGTVTFAVKLPDGTRQAPTIIRDEVGEYHVDYVAPQPGQYFYAFTSTGTLSAVVSGAFLVAASVV